VSARAGPGRTWGGRGEPAEDWPSVRDRWRLDPGVTHLNHGSFGAVPVVVREAQARIRTEIDENPMRFFRRVLPGRLAEARRVAAAFCGAGPDGFAFVPNIMTGVDTVLAGVPLRRGDEVLVTEHAYGAVVLAAERACARTGATVRVVRLGLDDGDEDRVEAITAAVTGRTRLAIVEHITSGTAVVLPTARIAARLRDRGVTVLVDGAHGPGMTTLQVDRLGADFWVGAFHKWVCAPHGTAGLVVSPAWRERLQPLVASWELASGYPGSFGIQGTTDPTPHLTVPAAIRFLADLGEGPLRRHNERLACYGAQLVADAFGTAADLPRGPFLWMRLVPLPTRPRLDNAAAKALQDRIAEELAVETSVVSWRGRGWIRVCAHGYNTPADYERLAGFARRIRRWL
jgi:isopenicillin-N epimerase